MKNSFFEITLIHLKIFKWSSLSLLNWLMKTLSMTQPRVSMASTDTIGLPSTDLSTPRHWTGSSLKKTSIETSSFQQKTSKSELDVHAQTKDILLENLCILAFLQAQETSRQRIYLKESESLLSTWEILSKLNYLTKETVKTFILQIWSKISASKCVSTFMELLIFPLILSMMNSCRVTQTRNLKLWSIPRRWLPLIST